MLQLRCLPPYVSGVLVHAPLHATDDEGVDLSLDVPHPLVGPVVIAGQPDVLIAPSAQSSLVHITRGQQDLWADPAQRMARFRDRDAGRFEFLLIYDEELAHLRALLRHRWVRGKRQDGPEITMVPEFPFTLDLGITKLDLRWSLPRPISGAGYELHTEVGEITITKAGSPRGEIQLRRRLPAALPPCAAEAAEWDSVRDGWLKLDGIEEYGSPPITVCDADRDWMYKAPYGGQDHILGRHRCHPVVARETDKYVILSRFAEGIIFDEAGTCNEDGYLVAFGYKGVQPIAPPPIGMRAEHGRLFIDRAALANAPVLSGNTIVVIMGNLSNYTHWLIDSLLALHVLLDYTPPATRLLLPGTVRSMQNGPRRVVDHYESLRVFGFDKLPTVEVAEPYCLLENAYWLEGGSVPNMPGEYIRSLRARVAALRPSPPRRDRRIHVSRRTGRRIANADVLQPFLDRQGFATHYLEDHSIDEQIDMFSQAEWVIGPHGAELGNLLFCRPGTKVLELSPDFDFKPYFSYMCNKLGLTHGILPCPTTDTSFNGDIILNMHKFAALFRMLKNRL